MAAEIRSGSLAVGARMPSLRRVIVQHGVSESTVFRAYYLLEEWGLIRAQERSGYYVARGAAVSGERAPRPARMHHGRAERHDVRMFGGFRNAEDQQADIDRRGVGKHRLRLANFGKLRIGFERGLDTHAALLTLACAVICSRFVDQFC